MDVETFNTVWQQIEETAQAIYRRLQPKGHGFDFVYREDRGKRVIEKEYDRIRKELKARCYEPPIDPESDSHLIDHHKIAACFCKALIVRKLFTFQMGESVPEDMLRSNYELAYSNTMFWIELYNRQVLAGQVEVKFPPARGK